MNAVSSSEELRRAINNLEALPAMPAIAQKLLTLRPATEQGERDLLRLIEQDPLISAKVIGLANTPLLGTTRKASTVRDAAMLLGMGRVHSIATGIAIMSRINNVPTGHFNVHNMWLHSLGIAFSMLVIAHAMPAEQRPPDDQVFLAGMLHDIGYLALAYVDPALSEKLHKRLVVEPDSDLLEIEQQLLGISHSELGALLAEHWNLPEELVGVLRHHHVPRTATAGMVRRLAQMINLSERLLSTFGLKERLALEVTEADWKALGIAPSEAEEIATEVACQAGQATQFVAGFS
jgi:HD-like signal output (HDOD) protein